MNSPTAKQPGTWTRLEQDQREAMERLADQHDRSLAAEMRQAAAFWIAHHNADGTLKS